MAVDPNRPDENASSPIPYKWAVLIVTIPAVMVVILDSTVVNVALAKLGAVFAVDISTVQWVITAFALALGIATPLASFLERRYSLKRVWLLALVTFTGASVVCGLSPAFWIMVVARLAQGVAGGVLVPMAISSIFQAFPPNERGTALGAFAIPIVAGPALGPTMGGYIVTYLDWRLIFFINLPIGIGATLLAAWLLHPGRPDPSVRMDVTGTILSSIGFGCTLYGLSRVGADGWGSLTVRGLIGVGLVVLVIFIIFELTQPDPLLDMRLFGIPQFFFANLTGWVSTIALFGAEFMLPLYLQDLRGLTALDAGLLLLPQGLCIAVAGPIGGRLTDKIGARPVVMFGFALLTLNTWQMAHITLDTTYTTLRWLLVARGLALGFSMQPTQVVAMSVVPPHLRTNASSVNTAMRGVFQSFGVAMLSTVVQTQSLVHSTMLSWQVTADSPQGSFLAQLVSSMQQAGMSAVQAQSVAAQELLAQISRQGANLGFADAYGVTFIAAIAAFCVAMLLPGRGMVHSDPAAALAG
ncbi:MAG TPA: DHA2 family efflux MFS transporter permease subunit [Chloroflexota bacterium]|nr:DHA2 family efflux MFS transporter permease subunit [Chloroflexota bacterium]